jgi:hypothetical protein
VVRRKRPEKVDVEKFPNITLGTGIVLQEQDIEGQGGSSVPREQIRLRKLEIHELNEDDAA